MAASKQATLGAWWEWAEWHEPLFTASWDIITLNLAKSWNPNLDWKLYIAMIFNRWLSSISSEKIVWGIWNFSMQYFKLILSFYDISTFNCWAHRYARNPNLVFTVPANVLSPCSFFGCLLVSCLCLVQLGNMPFITWANVDEDLCCHIASLGHNGLI